MAELPPDLDSLGDALTRAVGRRRHRIERRKLLALCVAAGLAVFAATTPTHLGSAEQSSLVQQLASVPSLGAGGFGCDRPRGDNGNLPDGGCDDGSVQPQAAR
jgi:hypothetical protein